jgi:hypothetical protein
VEDAGDVDHRPPLIQEQRALRRASASVFAEKVLRRRRPSGPFGNSIVVSHVPSGLWEHPPSPLARRPCARVLARPASSLTSAMSRRYPPDYENWCLPEIVGKIVGIPY